MSWLSKLFNIIKKNKTIPPMPSFEEIVEMMYDKSLHFADNMQMKNVIYSDDRTKRFIVLKSHSGYYKYTYEELRVFDEEEWMYICNRENVCPACWEIKDRSFAYSFFGTEEEAMAAMAQESEYKRFFA